MESLFNNLSRSLNNEIDVDNNVINRNGLTLSSAVVYRPLRFPSGVPMGWFVVVLFSIIFPVLVVALGLKALMKKKPSQALQDNSTEVFLGFSEKSKYIHGQNCPGISYVDCSRSGQEYLSYLSRSTLVESIFESIVLGYRLLCNLPFKYWLNVVHVYEMVVFTKFLNEIKARGVSDVSHCNHYDRWACLIAFSDLFSIKLFQHGILGKNFVISNKITNVIELYAINHASIAIFAKNILSVAPQKVALQNVQINIDEKQSCDVLIISNPSFLVDEVKLYHFIRDELMLNVIFRPHPISRDHEIVKALDSVSVGPLFPKPRLSICRESTLGVEYEVNGYEVLWWENTDEAIHQLKSKYQVQ